MGPEFNKSLRNVAKPLLESLGFKFDGKRRFTKMSDKGAELVVEYRIGIRSMQGSFTVNLIVGDSVGRLAMIKPTFMSKCVYKFFGNYDPWWREIFLPKDKWWKISPFQKEMDSIMRGTVAELESYGVAWLESRGET